MVRQPTSHQTFEPNSMIGIRTLCCTDVHWRYLRNRVREKRRNGGDDGTRTHDPLLAKQVL